MSKAGLSLDASHIDPRRVATGQRWGYQTLARRATVSSSQPRVIDEGKPWVSSDEGNAAPQGLAAHGAGMAAHMAGFASSMLHTMASAAAEAEHSAAGGFWANGQPSAGAGKKDEAGQREAPKVEKEGADEPDMSWQ